MAIIKVAMEDLDNRFNGTQAPASDNTYDLGTSDLNWRTIYAKDILVDGKPVLTTINFPSPIELGAIPLAGTSPGQVTGSISIKASNNTDYRAFEVIRYVNDEEAKVNVGVNNTGSAHAGISFLRGGVLKNTLYVGDDFVGINDPLKIDLGTNGTPWRTVYSKDFLANNNSGYLIKDTTGVKRWALWMGTDNKIRIGYNNERTIIADGNLDVNYGMACSNSRQEYRAGVDIDTDDGNANGSQNSHLGYWSGGRFYHYFRGKGSFNVDCWAGLNCNTDLRIGTGRLIVNGRKFYVGGDPGVANVPEGSVWIQV